MHQLSRIYVIVFSIFPAFPSNWFTDSSVCNVCYVHCTVFCTYTTSTSKGTCTYGYGIGHTVYVYRTYYFVHTVIVLVHFHIVYLNPDECISIAQSWAYSYIAIVVVYTVQYTNFDLELNWGGGVIWKFYCNLKKSPPQPDSNFAHDSAIESEDYWVRRRWGLFL